MDALMQHSLEQRIGIKFSVKLGKSTVEIFPMIKTAFGDNCQNIKSTGGTMHFQKAMKRSAMKPVLDGH